MRLTFTAGVLASVTYALAAGAEPYPSKPIRVIAPFPAGGTSDIIARTLGQKLGDAWNQPVIVDNRVGVAGIVGTELASHAPADGYTTLIANVTPVAINGSLYKTLPYNSQRDFAAVTLVAAGPNIVVVNPLFPAKTIKELITVAKSGARIDYGTSGAGSISHLAAEMFKNMTGTEMLHVPYKGGGFIITDLIGRQIQISFADMPVALPQVNAGKLRALAVTSAKASPLAPGVPSVAESGVPGNAIESWWGLLVPAGTPKEIVARLNAELVRILKLPDVRERFAGLGVEPIPSSQEQFTATINAEIAKYSKLIKAVGIRID
jgi:tripartite-type tricarboxylate transporter receptor subunit TctC